MINKSIVLNRFSKAINTYDKAATVQQIVAQEMLQLIQESYPHFTPHRVLELGCGTGALTNRVVEQFGSQHLQLTLNDIVPDVQRFIQQRIGEPFDFLLGDAERIVWPTEQDLIISNCSIQWWDDMPHYFRRGLEHTNDRGIVAASVFAQGHFYELEPILPHSLHYPSEEALAEQLSQLGYHNISYHNSTHVLEFPHLLALLQHIKATGANAFTHHIEGNWTPTRLRQLETIMRQECGISDSQPLTLTYKPIIIIAKK